MLASAILLAFAFSLLAFRLRFLRAGGAILMGLMGGAMLLLGGWSWLAPRVTFFVGSSLLTSWSKGRRGSATAYQARGGPRDAVQVLANGGLGCALVITNHFFPFPGAFWVYSGCFAAAAADTFATEIGTAIRGRTWSIVSARLVEPGTSGGVSAAGLLASVGGSLLVGVAAAAVEGAGIRSIAAITTAGFVAAAIDSLLGATVQARYRDPQGLITDARKTGESNNQQVGGLSIVDNDVVNFLCTAAGATLTYAVLST